jgi:hypothetical protein
VIAAVQERPFQMENQNNSFAIRTLQEVADIMTEKGMPMTRRAVWFAERRLFEKLKQNSAIQRLFFELIVEKEKLPSRCNQRNSFD